MNDGFGRTIDYLRISITDRCNLRCRYCMPDGIDLLPMSEILSIEEIVFIARVMAELGIRKIKVTGGEPLVRKGCAALIRLLKEVPGIEEVTLTTNGVLLKENLRSLLDAGLDAVNISIDTLDKKRYRMITGFDHLEKALSSVDSALDSGMPVKINSVSVDWSSLDDGSDKYKDAVELIGFAGKKDICVRFIEMMPIGHGKEYPGIPHSIMIPYILRRYEGMAPDMTRQGNGPAVYYWIPGAPGRIGFISAITERSCRTCNRVRLTTRGYLKTCLCYDKGTGLMDILRGSGLEKDRHELMKKTIEEAIMDKPEMHCFENRDNISEKHNMSSIGG